MVTLAPRVQSIKPSSTLAVANEAQALRSTGADIISLATGEPDFDTPDFIKNAAIDAIRAGFTKYTAIDGIAPLKQAIRDKLKRDNQLDYDLSQIIVTVGVKQGCYNLCQALLSPGDEVIIPAPYWVSYPDMVLLAQGTPVYIPTSLETHYKITPEQLHAAITPATKLLFFNSPSNPSGMAYTLDELKALARVLEQHPHVIIASDDMYEHILWSQPFHNLLNASAQLRAQTVVLNGVSKAYAMTGWRIGYAAGPEPLITAMKTIQSQSTSNPCSIAQKAAVAALNGGYDAVHTMRAAFRERHHYVLHRLNAMPGIRVLPADGTFYSFPNVQRIIEARKWRDDIEFAHHLLHQAGVALVPGTAFGMPGCVRISFAAAMEQLEEAMNRLQRFIEH